MAKLILSVDQVLIDAAIFRTARIVAFNRLEARPRTLDFTRSLRAEVRDPLWMLTRQWQFGEFKGEDAASPVTSRIAYQHEAHRPRSVPVRKMHSPSIRQRCPSKQGRSGSVFL